MVEVLGPVVAAVVGGKDGDGLDGVTPGGRGGDVGDEGEDLRGWSGDGSGDRGGVVDGEGAAVDVGDCDDGCDEDDEGEEDAAEGSLGDSL